MFRVALCKPEIPYNTGNISRLCVGTGCELILVGELGFSLDDAKLRRAGLDHWDDLSLTLAPDLDPLLESQSFALFSRRGQRAHWDREYRPGDLLVFGSETAGLPASLLEKHAERTFSLPLPGPARSLNLSNAVAVVVYEGLRQLVESGSYRLPPPGESGGRESFDLFGEEPR